MLAVALQAEVSAASDAPAAKVEETGHRLLVRSGEHNERELIMAAGPSPSRAASRIRVSAAADKGHDRG